MLNEQPLRREFLDAQTWRARNHRRQSTTRNYRFLPDEFAYLVDEDE